MTREEVAKKIRWESIIWTAGLINVVAMLPQLVSLVRTRNTEGLSLGMFAMFFFIQVAFSLEGYFKRNLVFTVSLGLSAAVSASIICLVLYLRHFAA